MEDTEHFEPIDPVTVNFAGGMYPPGPDGLVFSPERSLTGQPTGEFNAPIWMIGEASFSLRLIRSGEAKFAGIVLKLRAHMHCDQKPAPQYELNYEIVLDKRLDVSFIKDFVGYIEARGNWGKLRVPMKELVSSDRLVLTCPAFQPEPEAPGSRLHQFGYNPWFLDNHSVFTGWYFHEDNIPRPPSPAPPNPRPEPWACATFQPQSFEVEWFKP